MTGARFTEKVQRQSRRNPIERATPHRPHRNRESPTRRRWWVPIGHSPYAFSLIGWYYLNPKGGIVKAKVTAQAIMRASAIHSRELPVLVR